MATTKYVVLRATDGELGWEFVAELEATSPKAACYEAAETLADVEQAEMVAVPARSWKVRQVEIKLEKQIRVA